MEKKEVKELKELADAFRGAADILDDVINNLENEDIQEEERDKKTDELMGKFMWQMVKLNYCRIRRMKGWQQDGASWMH